MIKQGLVLRYAKALFELDLSHASLQKRVKDFQYVLQIFESYPKLALLLNAPQLTQQEKENLLKSCLKEINDPLFFQFLFYLIKSRRLSFFKEIFSKYQFLVNEHEGIWEAELISGLPVDPSIKEKIVVKLEKFYRKKIVLKEIIDPQIIGGLLLIMANHIIDWSIKSRLEKLKESLLTQNI